MPKTRLYIDVDDTLIAEQFEGSGFDLRPAVCTQLLALSRLFDCYWLTHWSHKDLSILFHGLYADKMFRGIKYMDWKWVDDTAGTKEEAVVKGPRDFYWLEDPLSTGSMKLLSEHNLTDRYIVVEDKGPWGFAKAVNVLFARTGIGDNELKRVQSRIGWFSYGLPDVAQKDQIAQGTFTAGFISNGKQHCGDCIHRLKGDKPYCIHPEVLGDSDLTTRLTVVDNKTVLPIDGDRDCCGYINKTQGE